MVLEAKKRNSRLWHSVVQPQRMLLKLLQVGEKGTGGEGLGKRKWEVADTKILHDHSRFKQRAKNMSGFSIFQGSSLKGGAESHPVETSMNMAYTLKWME
jgi:hypothetical protein